MKFDCGETWEEEQERKGKWHSKFAWFPVKVGSHDCRWLEYVERRGEYVGSMGGSWWDWEYRAKS